MSGILEDMVKRVVNTSGNNRTNHWKKAFDAVLDAYLGTPPTEFEYEGKKYTPLSSFLCIYFNLTYSKNNQKMIKFKKSLKLLEIFTSMKL